MKTAFIGLGSMGGTQAQLIARSGNDLAVYDSYAPASEAFHGQARIADSAADAARGAEIVEICVRDDTQVMDTVFGPGGAAGSMNSGTLLLVHSTIRLDTIRELSSRLVERGIALVDAPVTRTPVDDRGRFVLTMASGDPADIARASLNNSPGLADIA
jgi:3-hydroxyisobutyrate dehydrogenase-like beta-hydroxyacid dehydrogenase